MKIILLSYVLWNNTPCVSEAFSITGLSTSRSKDNYNAVLLYQQIQKKPGGVKTDGEEERVFGRIYQEWREEAAHMDAMEHSVESDADLAGVFEQKKRKSPHYMNREAHRHDSLLREIEHSIDTDSYLCDSIIPSKSATQINREYIDNEAHRHDSLLAEIAHSIDSDTYLGTLSQEEDVSTIYQKWKEEAAHMDAMEHAIESDADLAGVFKQKRRKSPHYMNREAHRHDSFLEEIEHSIDTDSYLCDSIMSSRSATQINQVYIDSEAHRHDSLLAEIAHSIDSDPYLGTLSSKEEEVSTIYQKWKEEAAHMDAMEHSVESDADLAGVFKQKRRKSPRYMDREAHRHDSLLREIEHSIDTDSYLCNSMSKSAMQINQEYIDNEAHRHDSLLDEIAHSVDSDPYLTERNYKNTQ